MESNKRLETIDDVIGMMYKVLSELRSNIDERGLEAKVGKILSDAKEPDEIFKAQFVLSCMEQFPRMRIIMSYLMQPVAREGIMQQKSNGTVELDDGIVPDGTRFEYLLDNAWHYGILHQDQSSKKSYVTNWKGDVEIERIEQLPARIRMNED